MRSYAPLSNGTNEGIRWAFRGPIKRGIRIDGKKGTWKKPDRSSVLSKNSGGRSVV